MTKQTLTDVDLMVLRMIGQDPFGRKRFQNAVVFFNIILLFFMCVIGVLEVFVYFDGMDTLGNVLFMETAFYQFGWKMFAYRFKICTFQKLLHQVETKFWPADKFGEKLEIKQRVVCDRARRGIQLYRTFVTVCMPLFFFIQPLVLSKRQLPFPLNNALDLNNDFNYVLLYGIETVVSFFGVPFLVGFDTLFVCLAMLVICQLNMLKHAFRSLAIAEIRSAKEEEECYKKIKNYVAHHNMLLEFISDINNAHSLLLLQQFLSCELTLCGILYLLTNNTSTSDYAKIIQLGLSAACFLTQLAMYCVGGSEIAYASREVGDAVYESDWWTQDVPRIRQATQLVILRSQRIQNLTAGGILDLNYATFISIVKTSFSFFTLMQRVDEKNQ